MLVKPVTEREMEDWMRLRMALLPDIPEEDQLREMNIYFSNPDKARCFIALIEEKTVGFIEVTIRDWVERCETPNVGYLEALYVDEFFRRSGVARDLIQSAEQWALQHGAKEMGSDVDVNNEESLGMHFHMNYKEVGRTVLFKKYLP